MVAEAWQPQVVSDRHMCTHIHINTQTNKVINNFNFFEWKGCYSPFPIMMLVEIIAQLNYFSPSFLLSLYSTTHILTCFLSHSKMVNSFPDPTRKLDLATPLALWEYYLTQPSSFFVRLWFPYLSVSTTSYEAKDPQRQPQNEARMHAYRHTHLHMHTDIHTCICIQTYIHNTCIRTSSYCHLKTTPVEGKLKSRIWGWGR